MRLPPDVDRFFSDVCAGLCAERFELLSGMFLQNQTENVFAALLFLVNRRDRATAIVVAIHGKAPGSTPVTHRAVEFNTGFRDRHVVQTNNSPVPTAFPRSDSITNTLLPSVKNPRLLYRVHCEQVRLRGGEMALRLDEEFRGDAVAYLQSDMIEELERAVGAHYLRLDPRTGIYRPTLKGAFLMTWGEL